MQTLETVRTQLKEYYHLARTIHEQGGPEKATRLFAQAVDLEDIILAHYGLPAARRFVHILQGVHRYKKISPQVIYRTLQKLEKAAAGYLLSTPLPDNQLLVMAKKRQRNAFDILPEMGVPTHDYTVFVYNHYLHHNKITPQQVLQEFQLLREHHMLSDIFKLSENKHYRKDSLYKELRTYRLQFLDAYLRHQHQQQKNNQHEKEMGNQLKQLLGMAAALYMQYLQLRSQGVKDHLARQRTGLNDDLLYRIALYTFMLQEES